MVILGIVGEMKTTVILCLLFTVVDMVVGHLLHPSVQSYNMTESPEMNNVPNDLINLLNPNLLHWQAQINLHI